MVRITVIGGSGYAGAHIVQEAVARGHQVTSYSRSIPEATVDGADYLAVDVLEPGALQAAPLDADVVVSALSPRGPLAGRTGQVLAELSAAAEQQGFRLAVIGGAGTLRIGETGPLVKDSDHFPVQFKDEAEEMGAVLEDLRSSSPSLDWFYVSPAGGFGSWAPGTRTGVYRIGTDQLLVDEVGESAISGADLAHAVLNEIEMPQRRRSRFTVAY